MLSDKKRALIAAIEGAVSRLDAGGTAFLHAAGDSLGLNRSDMRCLALLYGAKRMAVSHAAAAIGLTRGAMTTALDRLEKAGYLRRVPDRTDRRSVLVELTEQGRARMEALWLPVRRSNEALLAEYRKSELKLVLHVLEEMGRLRHAASGPESRAGAAADSAPD